MIFRDTPPTREPLRAQINALYHADGSAVMETVLDEAAFDAAEKARVSDLARRLIIRIRRSSRDTGSLETFLQEYQLSTREGVVLMCLAEALLRIPDSETADQLIRDKLGGADWEAHLGKSESLFVNASTWGLMLTGRLMSIDAGMAKGYYFGRLLQRSGEPLVRQGLMQAMRIVSDQFIMGRNIRSAMRRARDNGEEGTRHSFDMLGEAALTATDATRYTEAYTAAIKAIGQWQQEDSRGRSMTLARPGISIKLSALDPRFEFAQGEAVLRRLIPRLLELVLEARKVDVGVTIDAEEADRLELGLDVFEAVYNDPQLGDWEGFGLAVQAYQKRARAVIDWLAAQAQKTGRRIPVRLVKGAYWDTEVKRAQEGGFAGYPIYTRKVMTDVSYLACARTMLDDQRSFYPQFATHNAHTLAAIAVLGGRRSDFECQRLHGMGEALYRGLSHEHEIELPCRVYAPVGGHEDLLPYLVRRLLENGANTSFVNQLADPNAPIDDLVADPTDTMRSSLGQRHAQIPLPHSLFGESRVNSQGVDLSDSNALIALAQQMAAATEQTWTCTALVDGKPGIGQAQEVTNPAQRNEVVGTVVDADEASIEAALDLGSKAAPTWERTPAADRGDVLDRVANLYEEHSAALMNLAVREAGKTIGDAVAEVREAVDFCRYYAMRARLDFAAPVELGGPTGERNTISLHGRGTFACISPWNFPLAIFTGQVAAALAAGNAVVAKPAEQTPLIAFLAVTLMHQAGVPANVLHLLPGAGDVVGASLVNDPRVAGVAMTGSTETARRINQSLANRVGPIVPLIAETGGQNAMIADSSAHPEQLVGDVVRSAFTSAGQRCSALRVLFLQEEISDRVVKMLRGAMAELRVGDPSLLETDIGPVIDDDARASLIAHAERMQRDAQILAQTPMPEGLDAGTFFAPRAYAISGIEILEREVFGPILHIVRFAAGDLDRVVDEINGTEYGLTLGIHTRIDATAQRIRARARVGNVYVNRNMIGAVVGVQPFGGEGLSGTGPKAGGPSYLKRFATERTVSDNIAAVGGNPALLSLEEEASLDA